MGGAGVGRSKGRQLAEVDVELFYIAEEWGEIAACRSCDYIQFEYNSVCMSPSPHSYVIMYPSI